MVIDGEGNGNPLQYSCLENPKDGRAWWAAVHGVAKSRTWLSDFTLTFHFHALEKETATHSSVLPWRIPGMTEPGGLPSLGLHRVGHDWSDLAAAWWLNSTKLTQAKHIHKKMMYTIGQPICLIHNNYQILLPWRSDSVWLDSSFTVSVAGKGIS